MRKFYISCIVICLLLFSSYTSAQGWVTWQAGITNKSTITGSTIINGRTINVTMNVTTDANWPATRYYTADQNTIISSGISTQSGMSRVVNNINSLNSGSVTFNNVVYTDHAQKARPNIITFTFSEPVVVKNLATGDMDFQPGGSATGCGVLAGWDDGFSVGSAPGFTSNTFFDSNISAYPTRTNSGISFPHPTSTTINVPETNGDNLFALQNGTNAVTSLVLSFSGEDNPDCSTLFNDSYVSNDVIFFALQLTPCNAGTTAPSLNSYSATVCRSSPYYNLSSVNTTLPAGTTLKWYTTPSLTTEITNLNVKEGTYYAVYYDTTVGCRSPHTAFSVILDTDCDGIGDFYDWDDDNDGILDVIECNTTLNAIFPSAANNWTTGNYTIYSAGGNTDGTGYQKSGYQKAVMDSKNDLIVLNGLNDFAFAGNRATFANGTVDFTKTFIGTPSSQFFEYFKKSSIDEFRSANTGDGINATIAGDAQVGSTYSLNINFEKPVYAFSFDLLDAFDSYINTPNPETKYEVFVNGTLVSYIDGNQGGNDATVLDRSVKDASGAVKGTYTVGNNRETNFGIISKVPIGNVEVRYTVVSGGFTGGAYDPIGLDMFTYSVESCDASRNLDSDGDGCPDAIEGDENVTNANLNADGSINTSITGGIDANGVPKLVNSGGAADIGSDLGQGIGISQDPTQKEAAKITNTTPTSQTICLNGTATPITVTATGSASLKYQWYVNTTNTTIGGTAVTGATTYTFTPPTTAVGVKYYYLIASDNCGDATSAIVRVEVLPTPSVSLTASPAQICYDTTPAPIVTITNNSSYSVLVTYRYNTVNQTSVSIPAFGTKEIDKPTAVGTYTYQLVNAKYDGAGMPGCEVTLTESKTVEIVALPAITATVTNISCKGETNGSVTLTQGANYTYSKDGVNWQSSNVFSGLVAGSYTFYAKNLSGCTSSTTATITEPVTAINASVYVKPLICDATTTTITVTPPTGTGKTYEYKITDGASTIGWQTSNTFTIEDKSYKVYIKESGNANDATCNYLGEFSPTNECVQITKAATYTSSDGTPKTFINQVGDKILYTIKIENLASSSNTLNQVVITDSKLELVGDNSINVGTLAPGGSFTATSTTYPNLAYTVTQKDLDACEIVNTASFTANVNTTNGIISITDDASHTTPISSSPSWTLDKTAYNKTKPAAPGQPTTYSDENEIIEFTITLKNTGNVSISNISLYDPDYNGGAKVFYSLNGGILLPGESWVVTYSHTIELADLINNCSHTNPVTVSGTPSCGTLANITKSLTLAKKIIVPIITENEIVQPNCDVRTGSVTLKGTPYPGTFIVTAYADEVFYGKIERTNQTAVTFTGLAPGKSYTFVISQPGDCFSEATAAVAMNKIECIIAFDDMNQVPAGVPTSGNVLTNDFYTGLTPTVTAQVYNSSGALTPLTIGTSTIIYPSSGGTTPAGAITLNADGTYTFVPAEGFTGNVPVQYTITDSQGASSTAYLSITVIPAVKTGENNPPVANKDTYAVESGVTAFVKVLENDSDPDGDDINVTKAYYSVNNNFTPISENSASPTPIYENGVQIGTAYVNKTDGQIVFTPYKTYNGTVNFNYEISDGKGGTDSAFVQVVVLLPDAANDVIANDDANAAPKDKPMTGNILNNDYSNSEKGNLSVTSASSNGSNLYISPSADNTFVNEIPGVGTIVIYSDGKYVFEPVLGYVGTTPISYRTCDETGVCDMATLYLTSLETDIKFWTGIKTDEFDNPENWTSGVVPKNGENVVFATPGNTNGQTDTYNNMVIPSETEVIIHNLTNESEYATVVPPNTSLTITGVITGSSTPEDADKIVVEAANDGTTPNGTLIIDCVNNATESGGIYTPKPIYGTVQLFAKGKVDDKVTPWTDNIEDSPTKGITFETDIHWQQFGVPVEEIVANPTFHGAYLMKYFENLNFSNQFYGKWEQQNNSSVLKAFEGYQISQKVPTTYTISGQLAFCDRTLELTRIAPLVKDKDGNNLTGPNAYYGLGQNIFGNSFTSAIKISKMVIPDEVEKTIYLYNTGAFYEWGDASLNTTGTQMAAGSYLSVPKLTSDVWADQIPSMQGFLLKYTEAETKFDDVSNNNAKVTLTYTDGGVTQNTKPQLAPRNGGETVSKNPSHLHINLQSKSTVDNLWLFSQPGTSAGFDNGWDGRKNFGTPTAFIYAMTPNGPMQVNTNASIDGTQITLYSNSDKDYKLTLIKTNLEQYTDLHLVDLKTKAITPLTSDTTTYSFVSNDAGKTEKRFIIINRPASAIQFDDGMFDLLDGYITPDNVLTATNYSGMEGTIKLANASGAVVFSNKLFSGTNRFPVNLTPGIYIMQLQAGNDTKNIKVLVKK